MARSIRIQAAGAFYHVMARGNRREDIFHDDDDRRFFLHTLSQASDMTGWRAADSSGAGRDLASSARGAVAWPHTITSGAKSRTRPMPVRTRCAWRFATSPTRTSPVFEKATTDGVVFLMNKNKIDTYYGHGSFKDKNTVLITAEALNPAGQCTINEVLMPPSWTQVL